MILLIKAGAGFRMPEATATLSEDRPASNAFHEVTPEIR